MPVSAEAFRRVLGSFAAGVTIVTTRVGDEVHGTTMNAFCSVSLDPPQVLVVADRASDIHDLIAEAGFFAVNILRDDQDDLARTLSRKDTPEEREAHRLMSIPYRAAATGAPILTKRLAYADCRVVQAVEAGDHTIYVGQVEQADVSNPDGAPLLYYRRRYGGFVD